MPLAASLRACLPITCENFPPFLPPHLIPPLPLPYPKGDFWLFGWQAAKEEKEGWRRQFSPLLHHLHTPCQMDMALGSWIDGVWGRSLS